MRYVNTYTNFHAVIYMQFYFIKNDIFLILENIYEKYTYQLFKNLHVTQWQTSWWAP
jgi:hypothetical protein